MRLEEHRAATIGATLAGAVAIVTSLVLAILGAADVRHPILRIELAWAAAVSSAIALLLNVQIRRLSRYRRLDAMQRAGLLSDLRILPTLPMTIVAPAKDVEARSYAAQLLAVFREAGWPVFGVKLDPHPDNATNVDVLLAVRSGCEVPAEHEPLFDALRRVGVHTMRGSTPLLADDRSLMLFVGRRA